MVCDRLGAFNLKINLPRFNFRAFISSQFIKGSLPASLKPQARKRSTKYSGLLVKALQVAAACGTTRNAVRFVAYSEINVADLEAGFLLNF